MTYYFSYLAGIIYLIYNWIILSLFGIPRSLSETYYLLGDIKKELRFIFPIFMIGCAVLLLPSWLEISSGTNLQFTAFLAVGGLLFTGFSPSFKNSTLEDRVHTRSAYISAFFALIWVFFVSKLWWVVISWTIVLGLLAFFTKTYKSSYVFWLETITFVSTFSSIIIFYK